MKGDPCTAPGCLKFQTTDTRLRLCVMHIWRMNKHGQLDLPPRPEPAYMSGDIYVKVDREWQHRTILKAVIGEADHPCHWCNRMLRWGVDLHVDHVDGRRGNNDPHNLVPACNRCNTTRSHRPVERCKQGHLFTEDNTYINPASGSRVCRACSSAYKAEWQRAKRASASASGLVAADVMEAKA